MYILSETQQKTYDELKPHYKAGRISFSYVAERLGISIMDLREIMLEERKKANRARLAFFIS